MGKKEKEQGFLCTVKLGPKGQIVIPKEVRDMFGVGPGDSLVLMATPGKGIAMQKPNIMLELASAILRGGGKALYPDEEGQDMETFAHLIQEAAKEDGDERD